MRRICFACFAILILSASAVFAQPATTGLKAKLVHLTVRENLTQTEDELVGQSSLPGLHARIVVTSEPSEKIIGLDPDQSKLTSITDDTGASLTPPDASSLSALDYGIDYTPGGDMSNGRKVEFDVNTSMPPSPNAVAVDIKGTAMLEVGTTTETRTYHGVDLDGGTIQRGAQTITLKTQDGFMGKEVELSSSDNLDSIVKVAILSAGGNVIGGQNVGSGSVSLFGVATYSMDIGLEKTVQHATIRITFYSGVRSVSLPFECTARLGI